jgi:SAM-dependent methyltransferase
MGCWLWTPNGVQKAVVEVAEPVPRYAPTYLEQDSLLSALQKASREVEGGRLLDIGCGRRPYASLFTDITHYVGIDLPSSLSIDSDSPDVWASGLRLPFASGRFDVILCTQVLEHIPQPQQMVAEALRVLRTGGQLILTAPQTWGLHEEPHDYYRFTRYGLQYLLESVGFEVTRIEARGGVFRMIGQTFLNYLQARSSNNALPPWRRRVYALLNRFFAYLDRRWLWEKDTLGYIVLATRPGQVHPQAYMKGVL